MLLFGFLFPEGNFQGGHFGVNFGIILGDLEIGVWRPAADSHGSGIFFGANFGCLGGPGLKVSFWKKKSNKNQRFSLKTCFFWSGGLGRIRGLDSWGGKKR